MPEQYDPKNASRSPYGRPAESRPASSPAAEPSDPLAELARMVHGRPAPAAPLTRARDEPPAPTDLESELLSDLQASFAAVRQAAQQPAAPPRPQAFVPPEPPPAPEPPRLRPSAPAEPIFAGSFAPRAPTPAPAPPPVHNDPHQDMRHEFRLEPLDESRLVPIPSAPVIQPSLPPGYAERQAERAAAAAEPLPQVLQRAQRDAAAAPPEDKFTSFELRPSSAPQVPPPSAPPPHQTHSRWEKPPAQEPPAAASRFAPPVNAPPELPYEDDELDPFAEAGLFPASEVPDDEFEADEYGLSPGYAEDDGGPGDFGETAPASRKGGRMPRGLVIAAAVIAVALVGGISVAMFRQGEKSVGAPQTILADNTPTKITPDDSAPASSDADAQNKIIYDRVNSAAANDNTTLLSPDSAPIRTNDAPDTDTISRVILPGGPGYDAPASSGQAQQGTAAPDSPDSGDDSLGPRKVRTVVVKPDGTILSSSASDAPMGGAAPATQAPAADAAPSANAAVTVAPAPATDDTVAISGSDGGGLQITTNPDASAAPAIPATPAPAPVTAAPASVAAAPAPQPKPAKVAPTVVAKADSNAPIDLTPGGTAVAQATVATTAGDGVYVQISSQHTEDAARATYKDLQARYPTILGKYAVNLQQADVPSRGTFYRVRVGPFSGADAQRLCDDLRSAGGDCVLARH